SGYWVARAARDPGGPMLVPDCPALATQVIDARDLAAWLLACAAAGTTGTYDAVGPVLPFGEWIEMSRAAGGHTGPVVSAGPAWLREQGVEEYMGEESLPMWVAEPGWEGFSARSGAAALATGLRHRPRGGRLAGVADPGAGERPGGRARPGRAGLSVRGERDLLRGLG